MTTSCLLYGDVNTNVLDGSSVWLVSMAEALARADIHVTLLLKAKIQNERLLHPLRSYDKITIIEGYYKPDQPAMMSPNYAVRRMDWLDSQDNYDMILTRGKEVAYELSSRRHLLEKTWVYITDIPYPYTKFSPHQHKMLSRVFSRARRVLCQTEDARSYVEASCPDAAGKSILLPPMVADDFYKDATASHPGRPTLRLAYSGKFAPEWKTLEMCELPSLLESSGRDVTLTMVGDKFQGKGAPPGWGDEMREALEREKVTWLGGIPRHDVPAALEQAHLGLSWRSNSLNTSLEISTKVLEYCALGIPPVLNRTRAHEQLLGADYPFFLDGDSIEDVLSCLDGAENHYEQARKVTTEISKRFSIRAAATRLKEQISSQNSDFSYRNVQTAERPRVCIAGHDFKFFGEVLAGLKSSGEVDLSIDHWDSLHTHDIKRSRESVERNDFIVCEWAGPNLQWYSEHKREGQRLVARLHAFELNGPWMEKIRWSAVDEIAFVSEHYRLEFLQRFDFPHSKTRVIPNSIDVTDFNRPKLADSEWHMGLVGMVPFLKRPDRAIELLSLLLEHDERFTLHIRGRMPWEYSYHWNRGNQRELYQNFFARIRKDPLLNSRVVFEPFGPDMASWFRKIGIVLSPSSQESFHMAPAEGLASGSMGVIWERAGATDIFGTEFVVSSMSDAVSRCLRFAQDTQYRQAQSSMAKHHAAVWDIPQNVSDWTDLILQPVVASGVA